MKFVAGLGVSTLSGSQAGTTASRNANGAYFRNKSKPINKNSDAQKAVRQVFAYVAGIWAGLTAEQKKSFIDNASSYPYVDSLGQTKLYTGQQLCNKANGTIYQTKALPVITTLPPTLDVVLNMTPKPYNLNVVNQGNIFQSASNTWDMQVGRYIEDTLVDGEAIVIYATAPQSAGTTAPKDNMFRAIGVLGKGYINNTVLNVYPFYSNVFGTPSDITTKIWFRAAYVKGSVGLSTTPYQFEFSWS